MYVRTFVEIATTMSSLYRDTNCWYIRTLWEQNPTKKCRYINLLMLGKTLQNIPVRDISV